MSLRTRLVGALVAMLAIGLVVFGVGTYRAYSGSEYQRLDDQLRTSVGPVTFDLMGKAGLFRGDDVAGPRPGQPDRGAPFSVPLGTYGELRDDADNILATSQFEYRSSISKPKLAAQLKASTKAITVDSVNGSGQWRVVVSTLPGRTSGQVIVAVPNTDVADSLRRLVLVEVVAGAVLLALLASGSWLVLRRGLRPLESMADSARSINAGDLAQRVSPADNRSEVGQLGLALNTMLDEIQGAFTERDETEMKLRQFLADASHELRTPITSIQGFAELFRLGAESDHIDQHVIARRIEEESARMKRLVEDLLLLARLDETRTPNRDAVDLAVIAADACSDAAAIDRTRAISLDAPEPVVIAADRDHVRQAVTNLMSNALHHTPAGSAVDVSVQLHDGVALIAVRDHGPGLEPEALEHVFDRFWQADAARVGAGAGLGLAIVAAIAEEHAGTATVVNHAEGGAVFTLSLPVL